MIPTLSLIKVLVFASTFSCVQYLDTQITTRPEDSTITYLSMDRAIVQLYGGHAVLRCEGEMFTAYILEDMTDQ